MTRRDNRSLNDRAQFQKCDGTVSAQQMAEDSTVASRRPRDLVTEDVSEKGA